MQTTITCRAFTVMAMSLIWLSQVDVSNAQSDLAATDRATVCFDFQLQKMREGVFAQKMMADYKAVIDVFPKDRRVEIIEGVNRIYGALTRPDRFGLDLPDVPDEFLGTFEGFVRMEFADADSATQLVSSFTVGESKSERKVGEKTFLVLPEFSDLLLHRVNENTVEIGTELYLTQPTRQLMTPNLKAAFDNTPDLAYRLVMDLAGERETFYLQALQKIYEDDPGEFSSTDLEFDRFFSLMVGILDNPSLVQMSADLDNENLLSIVMTGKTTSDAEELRGCLEGVFEYVKLSAALKPAEDPDHVAAKAILEMINGLKVEQEGDEVAIRIARPSHFDAAAKSFLQEFLAERLEKIRGG